MHTGTQRPAILLPKIENYKFINKICKYIIPFYRYHPCIVSLKWNDIRTCIVAIIATWSDELEHSFQVMVDVNNRMKATWCHYIKKKPSLLVQGTVFQTLQQTLHIFCILYRYTNHLLTSLVLSSSWSEHIVSSKSHLLKINKKYSTKNH